MNEWLVFHAISQQRALFPDIPAEIMEKILSHRFDSPFHTDENILDNSNFVSAFDTSKYLNILDNELSEIVERKRKELDRFRSEAYVLFEMAYGIHKWYCNPERISKHNINIWTTIL